MQLCSSFFRILLRECNIVKLRFIDAVQQSLSYLEYWERAFNGNRNGVLISPMVISKISLITINESSCELRMKKFVNTRNSSRLSSHFTSFFSFYFFYISIYIEPIKWEFFNVKILYVYLALNNKLLNLLRVNKENFLVFYSAFAWKIHGQI